MLNGHAMSYGFPPLSIPAKRQMEYNEKMILFYESGDYPEMLLFLKACHDAMYQRFE